MLTYLIRFIVVALATWFGSAVGQKLFGIIICQSSLVDSWPELCDPWAIYGSLVFPILIPVLSLRLAWSIAIVSSVTFVFSQKIPWWFVSIPFVASIFLGYLVIDVWRVK